MGVGGEGRNLELGAILKHKSSSVLLSPAAVDDSDTRPACSLCLCDDDDVSTPPRHVRQVYVLLVTLSCSKSGGVLDASPLEIMLISSCKQSHTALGSIHHRLMLYSVDRDQSYEVIHERRSLQRSLQGKHNLWTTRFTDSNTGSVSSLRRE